MTGWPLPEYGLFDAVTGELIVSRTDRLPWVRR